MNLGTQKPGNRTHWFPMCYILHPDKVTSSHMMEDVVPGRKLPHPMLKADGTAKGLRCFCSHLETLPALQNEGSRLGAVQNRTEMSSQLNREQADEGNWRRRVLRSEDLARRLAHKWLASGGGGALEGVHTPSDQSGKTWLLCHSGLTAPDSQRQKGGSQKDYTAYLEGLPIPDSPSSGLGPVCSGQYFPPLSSSPYLKVNSWKLQPIEKGHLDLCRSPLKV
jgi:hypothetical protein